jgi:hypothetical protein
MSLIVRILDSMDSQLADVAADGRVPRFFVVREEEWTEITERFKAETASPVSADSYKGVRVTVGPLGNDDLAFLVH